MRLVNRSGRAFALYEVLLGVTIFVVGVLALGRSVENCLNASVLNAEESRIRLILSNRMSEIQATPGQPDLSKETKINTGYGVVRLVQKTTVATLTEDDGTELTGIKSVVLTAEWIRSGVRQSETLQFYVYRSG